jgi:hypothetical protein
MKGSLMPTTRNFTTDGVFVSPCRSTKTRTRDTRARREQAPSPFFCGRPPKSPVRTAADQQAINEAWRKAQKVAGDGDAR